jgi:hypothetical protein
MIGLTGGWLVGAGILEVTGEKAVEILLFAADTGMEVERKVKS